MAIQNGHTHIAEELLKVPHLDIWIETDSDQECDSDPQAWAAPRNAYDLALRMGYIRIANLIAEIEDTPQRRLAIKRRKKCKIIRKKTLSFL